MTDEERVMNAASTALAIAMGTEGRLITDSATRSHIEGAEITFSKIDDCVFAERVASLQDDHFLIVDFRRLSENYGGLGRDWEFIGNKDAACYRFVGSGVSCSGDLHVSKSGDVYLFLRALAYLHRQGCPFVEHTQ